MTSTTATTARAVDYDEIVRVLQLYIDGCRTGDVTLFEKAFHEDAWIFYTRADGSLHKGPISDIFQELASEPNPNVTGQIITVTQAGDVANVLLKWGDPDIPSNLWADLHNLIRLDEVWKITNKTATHLSRASGV